MQKISLSVALVIVSWISSGCATKGYVNETFDRHAAVVEERVTGVEQTLDDTADHTRRNSAHLQEVDHTATEAAEAAKTADASARSAFETASGAVRRAGALEASHRQLLFEIVLSEDHGRFGFADASLPKTATERLDALVAQVRDYPAETHIEVEGHTDGTGPSEYNRRLGLDRAESVKRYLYEHHRLPLHKINVFSYGEELPVAPNDTSEGRALNRRVVVRVLGGAEIGSGSSVEAVGQQ